MASRKNQATVRVIDEKFDRTQKYKVKAVKAVERLKIVPNLQYFLGMKK